MVSEGHLSKQDVLTAIKSNKVRLKQLGVHTLSLTGSYAEGHESPESDIDFLVKFEPGKKTYDNLYQVHELLTEIFRKKIELLTPEGVSPLILPFMEKIAIHERL